MPTTLVRRLISPLIRSRGFVDRILRQCAIGNAVKARKGSVFAVADVDAEHLTVTLAVTPVATTTARDGIRPRRGL
jgi:hypothetical protein